jgi:hypothetical protein
MSVDPHAPPTTTPWVPLWPLTPPTPVMSKGVSLVNTGTKAITWSYQPLPFDGAEEYDTDGFHSPSTNPSRITIPAGLSGLYLISGVWVNQTGGTATGVIRKNGVDYGGGMAFSFLVPAVPGDYFEIFTLINVETAVARAGSRFNAHYFGPVLV